MIGSFSRPRLFGASAVATLALMLLGFGAYPPSASANVLLPGMSGFPDVIVISPSATLFASTTGTLDSASFNASYTENVYSDPTNIFAAGDLDFIIRVQDISAVSPYSGDIEHITSASYVGFQTDVGYSIGGPPTLIGGTAIPYTVDRTIGADTISWDFVGPTGLDLLTPGMTTSPLVVETNTSTFDPGLISAIDGGSVTVDGFAPYAPSGVPEPGTLTILTAASCLACARRPRRGTSTPKVTTWKGE